MKISFKGNVGSFQNGKKPELKWAGEGDSKFAYINFWVAENKKKRDGSKVAVWHRVTVFRKYAEVMADIIETGKYIEVNGTLNKVSNYTSKDNRIVAYADIWADDIEVLRSPDAEATPEIPEEVNAEDAPF